MNAITQNWHEVGKLVPVSQIAALMSDQDIRRLFLELWDKFARESGRDAHLSALWDAALDESDNAGGSVLKMIERVAGATQATRATPAFDEAKRIEDIYEAEERAAEDAFTRGFHEVHGRQINVQVQAWELAAQAQTEHFDTHSTTSSYVTLPLQIDGVTGTLLTVFVQTDGGWMLFNALFQIPGAAGIQLPVERINVEVL